MGEKRNIFVNQPGGSAPSPAPSSSAVIFCFCCCCWERERDSVCVCARFRVSGKLEERFWVDANGSQLQLIYFSFFLFFFSDFATGDFKKIWFMKMVQCVKKLLCFRTCFIRVFFSKIQIIPFKWIEIHFNLLYFTFIYIYLYILSIYIIIIIIIIYLKFSQFFTSA